MKLMVLDGNSIINRAFYAIRLLTTKDGTPTNAVYGFLNILQKLIGEEEPEGLCVTFDLKAPTFRHLKYDRYKAQRKPMPEELASQLTVMKDVLRAMNIPIYELEGWEADDLIGTISQSCEDYGWDCRIVTGDKDSLQLVSDKTWVKLVTTRMGQTATRDMSPQAFFEEYGFEPRKIVDLKALMGDSSDNIPGVPGIGEKTAMELIRKYGTVENIYRDLDAVELKPAARKKMEAGRDMAFMSYDLATIHRDAPIDFRPEDALRQEPDNDGLYALFTRLEFTKQIEKLGLKPPTGAGAPEKKALKVPKAERIENLSSAQAAAEKMTGGTVYIAADSHDSFAFKCGESCFLLDRGTFAGDYSGALAAMTAPEIKKQGHNIKDIQRRLLELGGDTSGWEFDTALAAYLLDATASGYEIFSLAEKYCGLVRENSGEDDGQLSFMTLKNEADSLCAAAVAEEALAPVLRRRIEELGMTELMYGIELPLCRVLADMEHDGVLADRTALARFGEMLSENIEKLQAVIYSLAGEEFNINSPKQLGTVLFEKLMLPPPKKTKTGYSTNIDVLERLRGRHDIIDCIIEYRELAKLKSTYVDGLTKVIADDGRIHSCFQMTVTATGRLSSTEPNLQNIPVRKALGGEMRKMFVPRPGWVLVDADYSQIELRLLAHISGDETMRKAFIAGEDIHRVTASQVFGVEPEKVTSLQRSRAKAVNFGIVYGISDFSLAQDIGVARREAKEYIENYLAKYHGVREYMHDIVEKAKAEGYVATLYGRRRYLPELKSSNYNLRSFGERVALNMPIQGTAADIMKLAMVRVHDRLESEKLAARLILQVHDELIVEAPETEAQRVSEILKEEMEGAAGLSIPLTADVHTGKSWYEVK